MSIPHRTVSCSITNVIFEFSVHSRIKNSYIEAKNLNKVFVTGNANCLTNVALY